MLRDNLVCGVTLVVRMQAREGEFHGLMLDFVWPPGGWRGCAGGAKFYRAQDAITTDSASLNNFLISFVKRSKMERSSPFEVRYIIA
jgi:hypothetical protein